ncbi:Multimeric flavodoxin WrbA [Methanobrevibacter olleyae]|uniref:Multimeric flavodoxin WrbA n=1 Tax=Methanobrevibacter olleyae TaxID=294671 RepID=A0A1I4H7W0_METOL|nr:flavodoxin family protein [Methanobrevibacter olleyae]SFL38368.1 Multimeric flavodoxin WrbA [Methanobrevibacter olleyae]
MKTIVINASPRKKWNTAQIMKSAADGAESIGAEVEYIDLYTLDFKGCMSCLACKKVDKEKAKCYWKDELSPLIDKILNADTLLIGSPIYYGQPTSGFRALFERLLFCVTSFDGEPTYYKGKLKIGLFYTMNAPKEFYEGVIKEKFKEFEGFFPLLNADAKSYGIFDTVQVDDYSEFNLGIFDENHKKEFREKQFPIDLEEAFKIGAELSKE